MKLLHMRHDASKQAATMSHNPDAEVLARVWAMEGNLAHAVYFMHAEQAALPAVKPGIQEYVQHQSELQAVLAPQTSFYRRYTEGMLRRFAVLSMESGRVSSLLGREMFRGKVTSYRVKAFDDVVIFVHDVENCIKTLTPEQQHLIFRIGVQEYTYGEVAALLGCSLRSVQRHYFEALDELTAVFLKRRLLERIASDPCQEGGTSAKLVSHCP